MLYWIRVALLHMSFATIAQADGTISFLRELMRDPSRIPSQEESLRQIEEIKSARDIKALVPVAFEAVDSKSTSAQLFGASALYSIALRTDGPAMLAPQATSIMRLLGHSEPRLQTTCVILTNLVRLPPSMYEQKFLQFLSNPEANLQVKPNIIGALIRVPTGIEEKSKVIEAFLKTEMPLPSRIAALNAIASSPADQAWHADLVAIGLTNREEFVRQYSIGLLGRLGPNAIKRHSEELRRLASDPAEPAPVRQAAQAALNQQP